MLAAVDALAATTGSYTRVLYVTGHGYADVQGDKLYLKGAAGDPPRAVTLAELAARFPPSSPVLILWDACRDNPFGAELPASYKPTLPSHVSVLFSTQAGTPADDTLAAEQHTEFAKAVSDTVQTPGMTPTQLADRVGRHVLAATGGRQSVDFIDAPSLSSRRLLP